MAYSSKICFRCVDHYQLCTTLVKCLTKNLRMKLYYRINKYIDRGFRLCMDDNSYRAIIIDLFNFPVHL